MGKTIVLQLPYESWASSPGYQSLKNFVNHLTFINDSAERAVKMVSEFCQILTESSKSRRELIEVVEQNRKKYGGFDKKTLNE